MFRCKGRSIHFIVVQLLDEGTVYSTTHVKVFYNENMIVRIKIALHIYLEISDAIPKIDALSIQMQAHCYRISTIL